MAHRQRVYSIAGIVSLAVIFAGAGCASSEVGEPRRTSTASPSQSPTPTPAPPVDPLTAVVSLVIRPEAIELRDDAGATVASLSYEDPIAGVVAALTVAVEASPTVAPLPESDESPPGVGYTWPGFTLSDSMPTDGTFPELANFGINANSAATGGDVAILTQPGYRVGDSASSTANELGVPGGLPHFGVEYGPDLGPSSGQQESGYPAPNAWAVAVMSSSGTDTIGTVQAPFNFGVAHN